MKFNPLKLNNLKPDADFVRFVSKSFDQIHTIFNRQISFIDNCKTGLVSVAFLKANTQQAIQHGIGKAPTGYIVVESQGLGLVYDGASNWTNQVIYLQCSTVETKKLLIF